MNTKSHVSEPVSVRRVAPVPLIQKAVNLAEAAVTIVSAKVANPSKAVLVPDDVEADRLGKCRQCREGRWFPEGNGGMGECRHPDCGCTGYKLKFAAMKCPLKPPEWDVWKEGAS